MILPGVLQFDQRVPFGQPRKEDLLQDMNTLGFMFELLVIRDLRIYSQTMGGNISYYHDRYGLESDEGSMHLLELKELILQHLINFLLA